MTLFNKKANAYAGWPLNQHKRFFDYFFDVWATVSLIGASMRKLLNKTSNVLPS